MITRICAVVLILAGFGMAQGPGPGPMHMGGPEHFAGMEHHGFGSHQWWKNPEMVQNIGLSDAQVQKLDQLAQDHRLKMVDLRAAVEREEVRMKPLMENATPDESQIMAQIDKLAAARVQLQKANVQFMLASRRVLTPDQWKKFKSMRPKHEMGGERREHHERFGERGSVRHRDSDDGPPPQTPEREQAPPNAQ